MLTGEYDIGFRYKTILAGQHEFNSPQRRYFLIYTYELTSSDGDSQCLGRQDAYYALRRIFLTCRAASIATRNWLVEVGHWSEQTYEKCVIILIIVSAHWNNFLISQKRLGKRYIVGSGKSPGSEDSPIVYNLAKMPDPTLEKRDFGNSQICQDIDWIARQSFYFCWDVLWPNTHHILFAQHSLAS